MMSWYTQPPPVSISQAIQKFLSTQIATPIHFQHIHIARVV